MNVAIEQRLEPSPLSGNLLPQLAELGPRATLGDLPNYDFQVFPNTPGRVLAEEFDRRPELPGAVVLCADGPQLVSRPAFLKLISRPFGLDVYLNRPVHLLLRALDTPLLRLPATADIAEAGRLALSRRADLIYEPIAVLYPRDETRILDIHVLLLAQAHLLRTVQVALVQSEKLASLGQLAAGVAHEINNPLAYVINNVSILKRDVQGALDILTTYRRGAAALASAEPELAEVAARKEDEQDLPYFLGHAETVFDKTLDGLHRVRDIVKNLRDFARLEGADFADVDINACLLSALELVNYEIKRRCIRVDTRLGDLPKVHCHNRKMNQVFLNLLMNALQSCAEEGGTITLRTRAELSGVAIEVQDNGCGIPPEHLPRIFDPFFTTKPVGQGTGLGLSVSYGIVRDHGGSISVSSEPGVGSNFCVRVPRQPIRDDVPVSAEHCPRVQ
jgi:signal transduction histidine kinase